MKILVAHSTRHGATAEIAQAIAEDLAESGFEVDTREIDQASNLDQYDAFVLGSAVYYGHWLEEARRFVHDNQHVLLAQPVWLFSSGPVGEPAEPANDPAPFNELVTMTAAVDHVMFAGRLSRDDLGLVEKAVTKVVKAQEGDFRDWESVRAWARQIAESIQAMTARNPQG